MTVMPEAVMVGPCSCSSCPLSEQHQGPAQVCLAAEAQHPHHPAMWLPGKQQLGISGSPNSVTRKLEIGAT